MKRKLWCAIYNKSLHKTIKKNMQKGIYTQYVNSFLQHRYNQGTETRKTLEY